MAELLFTYEGPTSERHIKQICRICEDDGVIIYATDVNWALGCHYNSKKALARIELLKPHHPKSQPYSLICSSLPMIAEFAYIETSSFKLLRKIFPGPYTVLLTINRNASRSFRNHRKSVGVRIPVRPLLTDIVERLGFPLATTSLPPRADGQPFHFGFEVFEAFGHGVDLMVDLGDEMPGLETTIVDMSNGGIEVIREGAGPISQLGL